MPLRPASLKETGYGIHWFRRDLRLVGNPALEANLAKHFGRVLGLVFVDGLGEGARSLFFLKSLTELREAMAARGGDLLVVESGPESGLREVFGELTASPLGLPGTLSWNRDYEPLTRARDEAVLGILERTPRLELITERDHLLIEPHELLKDDGSPYQVFTPFKKRWLRMLEESEVSHRLRTLRRWSERGLPEFQLHWPRELPLRMRSERVLSEAITRLEKKVGHPLPPAGRTSAEKQLQRFQSEWLDQYLVSRDRPGLPGTSQLSVYLTNGTLTVPELIGILGLDSGREPLSGPEAKASHEKFLEELIWREFYYHILFHFPRVEHEPFQARYKTLKWENSEELFAAWRQGKTGYPIVDAGMRQLNSTGWMHNRLRMITASFLTKDLLVSWQWGERYFMQKLIDGDLAANNGGWQWAASTGVDPQPYFRIFNPVSQGMRFDADGAYLRRWAPEYLGRKRIHEPLNPVVDHGRQRERALNLYRSVLSSVRDRPADH